MIEERHRFSGQVEAIHVNGRAYASIDDLVALLSMATELDKIDIKSFILELIKMRTRKA